MRVVVLIAALFGCGRVGFERLGAGGDDDDASCTPFELNLPMPGSAPRPSLVWTGSEYLVTVLSDASTAGILPVSSSGDVGQVTPYGASLLDSQSIAWTGSRVAVTWTQGTSQWFAFYDPATRALGSPQQLATSNKQNARVIWTGDRLLFASFDTTGGVTYWENTADGASILGGTITYGNLSTFLHWIAATPTGYVFALDSPTGLLFQPFTGTLVSAIPAVGPFGGILLATPSNNAIAVEWSYGSQVQFFDFGGNALGPAGALPFGTGISTITAAPNGYRLTGYPNTVTTTVMTMVVDAQLQVVESPSSLTSFTATMGGWPSAIETSERIGFATSFDTTVLLVQRCK